MELKEWLQERYDNCIRIAAQKVGGDRAGWMEDAAYFKAVIVLAERRDAELKEARAELKIAHEAEIHRKELITQLAAAQQESARLREALKAVVDGNDLAHSRQHTLESWPDSYFRRQAIAALSGDAAPRQAEGDEG